MIYRRRASSLHAALAAAALAWCGSLAFCAILESNPLVLGLVFIAVLCAGALAGVGRELLQALRLALPLALMICALNALIARQGLTVIWRFGDLPLLGQTNVTLEATVYGAIFGLRAATLLLIGALYSLAVDPDAVLRLLHRWSFRSTLTATIATRMVPILIRDSRRLADAQRCRPGPAPGRVQLLRATTAGVLDRALDVAATLEVRGYGAARRPRRGAIVPWSRHDLAFSGSAVSLVALALFARVAAWTPFSAYPLLRAPAGARVLVVGLLVLFAALAPFADRRGVTR